MDSQLPASDDNSATWPRRAAKACASCRRDKIRCDGDRPCSGCTKKGFTADQCIDGCEHCRRARVRCEEGKPCLRCRQQGLECVEESISAPIRQDPSTRVTSRSQRSRATDRAKLACSACRRDNKKCGDDRPCSRCITRGEECIHVYRGPKLVKLRCEGCRKDNKKCEDSRPCKFCAEAGIECVNAIRKGRGHGTRVNAACTNCRRDKIRCEGSRPCATCSRKGYECIDRACKSCTQKGKESECTHRKNGATSDGDADHEQLMNPQSHASSSNTQEMPHPMLPPMSYTPYPYGVPHYYGPSQPYPGGPGQPHGQPHPHSHPAGPPLAPENMFAPEDQRVYYPVIDPHLEPPGTSSERFGPGGDGKSSGQKNN